MIMNGQKIWSGILAGVKSQISSSMFRTWFGGSYVVDFTRGEDKNVLVVGLRNSFIKEQVESRFLPIITREASRNGVRKVEIVFKVCVVPKKVESLRREPLFTGVAPTYLGARRLSEHLNPGHTLANFVVGPSNNLAYLACQSAVGELGKTYNPLFIYGPTGVGKTHLLQAVGNEVLDKYLDGRVLYASAEKFTNDYLESLRNKTMPAFRNKYRNVDLLLVDDVQFLAGKESTQDEFFYTFNELSLSGRQIVLAADRHPTELARTQERLGSRFLAGMTVDIALPDLELRIAILRAKCREHGMTLDDEMISYIAQVCQSNARELEGILVQVLATVKLSGGKTSLETVRGVVEKQRVIERPPVTPGKIIEAVCRNFKVSSGELCGPKRKARLVRARQVLMYLLRQELNLPLGAVGTLVGGRDHSTVLYSIGKVEREVLVDQNRRDQVMRVKMAI